MTKANPVKDAPMQRSAADFTKFRRRVLTPVGKITMTEQNHKAACDVNNIMARYTKTGVMEHVRAFEPVYSDTTTDDYQNSMNVVADAKTMFEELPSSIRRHFGDDPSEFLEFCTTADDPVGDLQGLAEGYRKRALGIPEPDPQPEVPPAAKTDQPAEVSPPEEPVT